MVEPNWPVWYLILPMIWPVFSQVFFSFRQHDASASSCKHLSIFRHHSMVYLSYFYDIVTRLLRVNIICTVSILQFKAKSNDHSEWNIKMLDLLSSLAHRIHQTSLQSTGSYQEMATNGSPAGNDAITALVAPK